MDHLGIVGGKPPHVVEQAGYIIAMDPAEVGHGESAVFPGQVGVIVHTPLDRRSEPFHQGDFSGLGYVQALAHMPGDFIQQENYRRSIRFGNIEGIHRQGENVLMVGCREGDNGVIAMGPPARLIDISLAYVGGDAGRRPPSLHVDDDTGNFRHYGIAQCLLH